MANNSIDPRKIFEAIRMQNILGQSQSQVPEEPTPTFQSQTMGQSQEVPEAQTTPEDLMNIVNRVYRPEYADRDTLRALLDSVPQREAPSFARKLVASGASLGAPDPVGTADKILDAPYNRSVADWKEQVTPRYQLAQLENLGNANERALAGNVANATANLERSRVTEQKNRDLAEIARKKNEIAAAVANGAKYYSRGNTTLVEFPDGTIYDSGVDPKNFSPIEVANINAAAGIKRSGIAADATKYAANTGAASRETIANDKGWSQPVMITGPDGKQMAVQTHQSTGEVREVKLQGKNVGQIVKPGTPGKSVQPGNIQDIQNSTRETLDALNELLDEKGNLRSDAAGAVGKSRMFGLQHVPATATRAADAKIQRLKNRITIGLIGEMKAQSKTGATGFGALNLKELEVLEKSASLLDPTLDETTFTTELKRIKERLEKIVQPSDGLTPVVTRPPTAAELLEKYSK